MNALQNEIVKIEEDYRNGDVKDFYDKWNKLPKNNGVFDSWVNPYNFESRALKINDLVEIKQEDSSFIFNSFLEILRHNVVSDKPNAFNKIFTLFLCKIYDEKSKEGTDEELDFQWLEGKDDDVSFQLRLTDLYKNGMEEFLEKQVTDFSDDDLDSIDLEQSYYIIINRTGFVDSVNYSNNALKKKSVMMFNSGSCFNKHLKGQILDVSNKGNHKIYRYGIINNI